MTSSSRVTACCWTADSGFLAARNPYSLYHHAPPTHPPPRSTARPDLECDTRSSGSLGYAYDDTGLWIHPPTHPSSLDAYPQTQPHATTYSDLLCIVHSQPGCAFTAPNSASQPTVTSSLHVIPASDIQPCKAAPEILRS
jgi:hypothetical protein